jgi:hypothetical protein
LSLSLSLSFVFVFVFVSCLRLLSFVFFGLLSSYSSFAFAFCLCLCLCLLSFAFVFCLCFLSLSFVFIFVFCLRLYFLSLSQRFIVVYIAPSHILETLVVAGHIVIPNPFPAPLLVLSPLVRACPYTKWAKRKVFARVWFIRVVGRRHLQMHVLLHCMNELVQVPSLQAVFIVERGKTFSTC